MPLRWEKRNAAFHYPPRANYSLNASLLEAECFAGYVEYNQQYVTAPPIVGSAQRKEEKMLITPNAMPIRLEKKRSRIALIYKVRKKVFSMRNKFVSSAEDTLGSTERSVVLYFTACFHSRYNRPLIELLFRWIGLCHVTGKQFSSSPIKIASRPLITQSIKFVIAKRLNGMERLETNYEDRRRMGRARKRVLFKYIQISIFSQPKCFWPRISNSIPGAFRRRSVEHVNRWGNVKQREMAFFEAAGIWL